MSLVNLANTKARLIGCSALYAIGQCLSSALSGPAAGMAAPMLGGPVGVFGASVLATLIAGIVGNITAGELGNKLAQRVGKNADILKNGDLTAATGEAISRLLTKVAESEEIIVIAEQNHLNYAYADFQYLANKTVAYWLEIDAKTDSETTPLNFSDSELAKIFSADANQFLEVTGLQVQDWQDFLTDFAAKENKTLHPELIACAAQKLHESFPKAFREVLKQDAETGGRQFAGMQLILHRETLAQLKDLGLQNGEVLQRLEALATREQICEVMARLSTMERGIRDEFAEIRELLQDTVPSLPLPYECETIIADRAKDFTGRRFVFKEINSFFRKNSQGYFVLEADPGVGKSAILAQCVLRLNCLCIAHFNSQSEGIVRAEQFLSSVCTQLIQRYSLDYKTLPENATTDGYFLKRLLGEVSKKLGRSKLVFVVDALDEVNLKVQSPGSNVLYLPEDLPKGIYFIVSKRPESLRMPKNHFLFDLMQHNAESVADVKAYIHKKAGNSAGIQSWIQARNSSLAQFVTVLADRSKNNFMYLRYVLNEIDSDTYSDVELKDLPAGLEEYYYKHLDRMEVKDKESRRRKLKVIYLLSKTRKPVSCELLANFAKEDELDVQDVLDGWEGFVRRSSENHPKYSIYHASFQRFLHSQEAVKKAGISLSDIDDDLEDDMWEGLYGDG
ncbi:ATP-binding protein [Microcoleus sp. herbarium13]|uniref:ATP-binding protein n=2 Tax=unclassified Microcoleus TaxID=2642155 RepID=UPI002FD0F995